MDMKQPPQTAKIIHLDAFKKSVTPLKPLPLQTITVSNEGYPVPVRIS